MLMFEVRWVAFHLTVAELVHPVVVVRTCRLSGGSGAACSCR